MTPSASLVAWSRLALGWVLVALVVVLMLLAYGRAESAEQQVRDIRAASARRVDGLLAENRQQQEQIARLREQMARLNPRSTP